MASRIPNEMLESIGKRLNTRTDVSRFRAVCKSWRSSIPPFQKLFQLPIQILLESSIDGRCETMALTESVVYHVAPPWDSPIRIGWLIKVKEGRLGETESHHQMLHLLSPSSVERLPDIVPKVFDLLKFRVFELAKVYTLCDYRGEYHKVAVSLNLDFAAVMLISRHGTLYYAKLGVDNEECIEVSPLDDERRNYDYEDVTYYQGKFYALSSKGVTAVVDSSLKIVSSIEAPIGYTPYTGHKKLVESFGELLLVVKIWPYTSRFLGFDSQGTEEALQIKRKDWHSIAVTNRFEVFRLNAVEKQWVKLEKEALDDRILFVGIDGCFSFSNRDFPKFKPGSIHFKHQGYGEDYSFYQL